MKKSFIALLVNINFLLVFLSMCSCGDTKHKNDNIVNVGIQNSPSNSLIIIASQKGFFDSSKLKVNVKNFSAGKLALQALLGTSGDVDVAVCAETPIVLSSLGGNSLKVISQVVDAKNECRMVVKMDGDKKTPVDYFSIKRKIATSKGGSPEWLTYNFVNKYAIPKDKIEIIAMQPQDMPVALTKGAVDGINIFDPFARLAEKQMGVNGITFLNPDISSYYVLAVRDKFFSGNQKELIEFLKGLKMAADFISANPTEAKQLIAKYTGLDINIINETWHNYSFKLGMDSNLIRLSNEEAKWAITNGAYSTSTAMPKFDSIFTDQLLVAGKLK